MGKLTLPLIALGISCYSYLLSYSVTPEGRMLRAYDVNEAIELHNTLIKNGAPDDVLKIAFKNRNEVNGIKSIIIHYLKIDGYAPISESYDEFLKKRLMTD